MTDLPSPTFCPAPWISVLQLNDMYVPCCEYKDWVKLPLKEYFESEHLNDLKQQLLTGQKPRGCNICWQVEESGALSKRERLLIQYKDMLPQLAQDNYEKSYMTEYWLKLGNLCNLRCRTCEPTFSTRWQAEYKRAGRDYVPTYIMEPDHDMFRHIKDHAANVTYIVFSGGETFMNAIDQQQDILQYLVDAGYSKNITLKYYNNTTQDMSAISQYWKHFKYIDLHCSVDGYDKTFEYLRNPAKWENTVRWLQNTKDLEKQIPSLEMRVIFTMSVLSIPSIKKTKSMLDNMGIPIFLPTVSYPVHYAAEYFNIPLKQYLSDCVPEDVATVQEYKKTLPLQPHIPGIEQRLITELETFDQGRGEDWRLTFPDLVEYLT